MSLILVEPAATFGLVDEARAVLARLERIEALDRSRASRDVLLAELRALVGEADAWARAEGGDVGRRAADCLRTALDACSERAALDACGEQSARDMIAV